MLFPNQNFSHISKICADFLVGTFFFIYLRKITFKFFTDMEEQILINYTPNEDGFTLSVMAGEKSTFDSKNSEHEPKDTTLQFIEGLQRLINEIN